MSWIDPLQERAAASLRYRLSLSRSPAIASCDLSQSVGFRGPPDEAMPSQQIAASQDLPCGIRLCPQCSLQVQAPVPSTHQSGR